MSLLEGVAIFCGGIAAGTINAVVGSGTLITFPLLIAFGYRPGRRPTSRTPSASFRARSPAVGATGPSSQASARRLVRLGTRVGARRRHRVRILLLALPASAFDLRRAGVHRRRRSCSSSSSPGSPRCSPGTAARASPTRASWTTRRPLRARRVRRVLRRRPGDPASSPSSASPSRRACRRSTRLKNVLTGLVNLVRRARLRRRREHRAAALADRGRLGGRRAARVAACGRRLPPAALRAAIVAVGIAAIAKLLLD